MVRVRRAAIPDIPLLLPMLVEFASFAGTRHSLYPGHQIAAVKMASLINEHVVLVAEQDRMSESEFWTEKQPIMLGFIVGVLQPHWFNEDITLLSELMWWVDPEHRGSRAGAMLFKAFCDYGEQNAHQMTMVLERNSPVREETLESRGFHLHERTFLREMHV